MRIKVNEQYPFIVKITWDDDGQKVDNPKWHYYESPDGANRTLCTGEVFGIGEGRAIFDTKQGKITCPDCIAMLKKYKSIKL